MAGDGPSAEAVIGALDVIARWRNGMETPLPCPVCGVQHLTITDHSARPHAEWYRLTCAACGLDRMLNVPLGAVIPGSESAD